ncbi:MAG: hypothetical protein Q7T18_06525 [Sedimentisphaerales bacterium]|nr:hypothetical protein [Sedimentisphaerales bacterium]
MRSQNSGWQLLRTVSAVDNPALGVATIDGKPSYAMNIAASAIRGLEFLVVAIGADDSVVGIKLWCGRGAGGPAKLIAAITWTLGKVICNKDPQTQGSTDLQRYADSASVTSYWPLDVNTANSGNDMLCTVSFDGIDADWIAAEVVTLTNATKANIYMGCFE